MTTFFIFLSVNISICSFVCLTCTFLALSFLYLQIALLLWTVCHSYTFGLTQVVRVKLSFGRYISSRLGVTHKVINCPSLTHNRKLFFVFKVTKMCLCYFCFLSLKGHIPGLWTNFFFSFSLSVCTPHLLRIYCTCSSIKSIRNVQVYLSFFNVHTLETNVCVEPQTSDTPHSPKNAIIFGTRSI